MDITDQSIVLIILIGPIPVTRMDIIDRVGTIVTITALTGMATIVAIVVIGKVLARGRDRTSRFYRR
jgi:hypothetical protein